MTPVMASIPAAYQPWAIAPHSEDQKGQEQDKHLELPPQCAYGSSLYHSFLTEHYHTGILTAAAGPVLSARVGHGGGSEDAALYRQEADKSTVTNLQVPCHLVESKDPDYTPGLFIKHTPAGKND